MTEDRTSAHVDPAADRDEHASKDQLESTIAAISAARKDMDAVLRILITLRDARYLDALSILQRDPQALEKALKTLRSAANLVEKAGIADVVRDLATKVKTTYRRDLETRW